MEDSLFIYWEAENWVGGGGGGEAFITITIACILMRLVECSVWLENCLWLWSTVCRARTAEWEERERERVVGCTAWMGSHTKLTLPMTRLGAEKDSWHLHAGCEKVKASCKGYSSELITSECSSAGKNKPTNPKYIELNLCDDYVRVSFNA